MLEGIFDAFLVKFNTAGVRQWGTYFGGSGFDIATHCSTDISGNVYLAGFTTSTSNIATRGHQNYLAGNEDLFLAKFGSSGNSSISEKNTNSNINIYPNPAKDHITIDYGVFSKMSGYTMKITNTLGQTVFSSPINQQSSFINLSSWTGKGVYYLQIIDTQSNMIENRKIVLQ
jgi:hypothetical protein